jgi:hypothetical protein
VKTFDPLRDVKNSQLILEEGQWPNFHDAEVHELTIWRGDVRPDDGVWIGPVIEASFELCALQYPFTAVLKFHDCDAISLQDFNQQNAVYDLTLGFEARGHYNDGAPLPPFIAVTFEQAFGAALCFRCSRVEVLQRRAVDDTELRDMLRALAPRLMSGEFVFCTVPLSRQAELAGLSPLASFREEEGQTLVIDTDCADKAGLDYDGVFRCVTLGVNSSLDSVGLTAAVSTRLARRGISANVIAAYHHDHIFVPTERAHEALAALQECSAQSGA